jgi:hypothetical protein
MLPEQLKTAPNDVVELFFRDFLAPVLDPESPAMNKVVTDLA